MFATSQPSHCCSGCCPPRARMLCLRLHCCCFRTGALVLNLLFWVRCCGPRPLGARCISVIGLFLGQRHPLRNGVHAGGFFVLLYGGVTASWRHDPAPALPYRLLSDSSLRGLCRRGGLMVARPSAHRFHADYDLPLLRRRRIAAGDIRSPGGACARALARWLRWIRVRGHRSFVPRNSRQPRVLVIDLHNDLLGRLFLVRNLTGEWRAGQEPCGQRRVLLAQQKAAREDVPLAVRPPRLPAQVPRTF